MKVAHQIADLTMTLSPFFKQCLILLVILLAVYAVYVALLLWKQDEIIFVGEGMPQTADLTEEHVLAQFVSLPTEYGEGLGCYVPAKNEYSGGPVAIVAHGNAESISNWSTPATYFQEIGLSLFLIEYPGYGGAKGECSQESIRAVFTAGYDWMKNHLDLTDRKVLGLGRSLGTGVITELANERALDGLILISPFTSIRSMAWRMGIPGFLVRTQYDNRAALSALKIPVHIVHGRRDGIIKPSAGKRLSNMRPGIELHLVDTGHNDLWEAKEPILEQLGKWLEENDFWNAESSLP